MPENEEGGTFSEGAPASPTTRRQPPEPVLPATFFSLAQDWHDDAAEHPRHQEFGGYSSCWCCCCACDPDYYAPADVGMSNPWFVAAQRELAG